LAPIAMRAVIAQTSETNMTPNTSRRESDDGYDDVIARLNSRWRVIACKDRIQWILQSVDGLRNGAVRWTGESYHCTREALIRVCRSKAGDIWPSAAAVLAALPARFGGSRP